MYTIPHLERGKQKWGKSNYYPKWPYVCPWLKKCLEKCCQLCQPYWSSHVVAGSDKIFGFTMDTFKYTRKSLINRNEFGEVWYQTKEDIVNLFSTNLLTVAGEATAKSCTSNNIQMKGLTKWQIDLSQDWTLTSQTSGQAEEATAKSFTSNNMWVKGLTNWHKPGLNAPTTTNLLTVAGEATAKSCTSNNMWMNGVNLILSEFAKHNILLSSSTVFMFSIQRASTGPSHTIHWWSSVVSWKGLIVNTESLS